MMLGDFFTDCTLLARTVTDDGFGSVTETWQDGTDIRAGIGRRGHGGLTMQGVWWLTFAACMLLVLAAWVNSDK